MPRHLQKTVLAALHDDPTAGHLGFFKTYERVRRRFFWPRLYRTIHKYVPSCRSCQQRKPGPASTGPLQPLPPPAHPFATVGVDLFGPLPLSASGNRWIVTAVDHLTRYVVAAALPTATAAEVASFSFVASSFSTGHRGSSLATADASLSHSSLRRCSPPAPLCTV